MDFNQSEHQPVQVKPAFCTKAQSCVRIYFRFVHKKVIIKHKLYVELVTRKPIKRRGRSEDYCDCQSHPVEQRVNQSCCVIIFSICKAMAPWSDGIWNKKHKRWVNPAANWRQENNSVKFTDWRRCEREWSKPAAHYTTGEKLLLYQHKSVVSNLMNDLWNLVTLRCKSVIIPKKELK